MAGSDQNTNCCTSCCRSIILSGISFLITYLVYRATTKTPRLYLANIDATGPGPNVTCQIEIKNRARFLGIYYDDLLVTVTYPPAGSNASAVVPAFYQGFHKRAFKDASLIGAPWTAAKTTAAAAGSNASASLRVEVDTRFRYKASIIWKSKRYGISVHQDVQVNADGKMTSPDHVLLSGASVPPGRTACVAAGTTAVLALLSMI